MLLGLTSFTMHAQLVSDGTTASINATPTNITGTLIIGSSGSFTTLIITNTGTVTNTGLATIGSATSAKTNQVVVTDSNSIWSSGGGLLVGSSGSFNSLTVSNGAKVLNTFCNLGNNASGSNNVILVTGSNSLCTNSSDMTVGSSGISNRLIVANGGKVVNALGRIGFASTSIGNSVVITDGSQWINNGELQVGKDAAFNQVFITNGGQAKCAGAYVGGQASQAGTGKSNSVVIAGTGSSLTNTSTSAVGNSGSFNQLTISNGAAMRNTDSFGTHTIGMQPGSTYNIMFVTGTNSRFSSISYLEVGRSASFNQMLIRDGGVVESFNAVIGSNTGSTNNIVVTADPGSAWTNTSDLLIGDSGAFNQLFVTNGGLAVNLNGYIGGASNGLGNVTTVAGTGSLWVNLGALYIGNFGASNQLVISSAGTVAASNVFVGLNLSSTNNIVTVIGGNLIVTNAAANRILDVRRGGLTLGSGLIAADKLFLTNGAQSQFTLSGGTLQVRHATVTNSSVLFVGDGVSLATLELLANGTNAFANGLLISANGILKGNGTIFGNVTNSSGGTLSPGASIGQLVINGNLTLAGGSTNVFELDKSSGTNDNISGISTLTLGGTLVLTNLGGTLAIGDTFKLFSAGTYGGSFDAVAGSAPGPGLAWYYHRIGVNGFLRVISATNAVPTISGSPTFLNGTNFVITASGGTPFNPVSLLTSTNVATNWVLSSAHDFDASGNVAITNAITPDEFQRYFRLQVQ